ncbi:MAG: hypothetical protein ACFFD1_03095 [Candidatus Thorarchaeota archaeon]
MDVSYNVKAYFYMIGLFIIGLILYIFGIAQVFSTTYPFSWLNNELSRAFNINLDHYGVIIGAILLLVSILVIIVLSGIIFALRMYSEEAEFTEKP